MGFNRSNRDSQLPKPQIQSQTHQAVTYMSKEGMQRPEGRISPERNGLAQERHKWTLPTTTNP